MYYATIKNVITVITMNVKFKAFRVEKMIGDMDTDEAIHVYENNVELYRKRYKETHDKAEELSESSPERAALALEAESELRDMLRAERDLKLVKQYRTFLYAGQLW